MLQTSFSFKAASCAIARVGPRPKVARLVADAIVPMACVQSHSAALANRSGKRSRAERIEASSAQAPTKFRKRLSDPMKLLVAATLNSGPALIGRTTSQTEASELS